MNIVPILKIASIAMALTAFGYGLHCDRAPIADDPLDAAIAEQALRVEAAYASIDAKPLIGESHLPPYDARAAVAREEAELHRLSSLQTAAR